MKCENDFCIYWQDGECVLEDISIDIGGRCDDCIYVNIPEEQLKIARKEILDRYDD